MGTLTVQALRVVLALGLAGSVFVQTVMVPLLARDLDGADAEVAAVRIPPSSSSSCWASGPSRWGCSASGGC